jgi:hypothetical protein
MKWKFRQIGHTVSTTYTFKYMCWERNFIISSLPTPALGLQQEFCGTCGNWCPANVDCGVAILQHVETWKSAFPLRAKQNAFHVSSQCPFDYIWLPCSITETPHCYFFSISLIPFFLFKEEMKWKSLRERTPTCPADRILRHVAVNIWWKKCLVIQCTWSRRRATILDYFRVLFYLMCWNDLIIDLNKIHRLWNIDGYEYCLFWPSQHLLLRNTSI